MPRPVGLRGSGANPWVILVRAKDTADETSKFIEHIYADTKAQAEAWFNATIRPLYKKILKLEILPSTEETERRAKAWLWR